VRPLARGPGGPPGVPHRDPRLSPGEADPAHRPPFGRRAGAHGALPPLRHLPGEALPLLRAGRGGRPPGRVQHRPVHPPPPGVQGRHPVRGHHPQPAHHRGGGLDLRRHDGGAGGEPIVGVRLEEALETVAAGGAGRDDASLPLRVGILGSGVLLPTTPGGPSGHWVSAEGPPGRTLPPPHRLRFGHAPRDGPLDGLPWGELTHIVVSHFHTDHFGDLAPVLWALRWGIPREGTDPLHLLGPAGLHPDADARPRRGVRRLAPRSRIPPHRPRGGSGGAVVGRAFGAGARRPRGPHTPPRRWRGGWRPGAHRWASDTPATRGPPPLAAFFRGWSSSWPSAPSRTRTRPGSTSPGGARGTGLRCRPGSWSGALLPGTRRGPPPGSSGPGGVSGRLEIGRRTHPCGGAGRCESFSISDEPGACDHVREPGGDPAPAARAIPRSSKR
jgi:hypothetical protein